MNHSDQFINRFDCQVTVNNQSNIFGSMKNDVLIFVSKCIICFKNN